MNAKKRCVAVVAVVVSLVWLVLLLVSALDVHLDAGFRLPPSPDKWRRPKEKWFRFAHVASDFLGRISGMFSFHFIFLISLNLLGVCRCVCVLVCVR